MLAPNNVRKRRVARAEKHRLFGLAQPGRDRTAPAGENQGVLTLAQQHRDLDSPVRVNIADPRRPIDPHRSMALGLQQPNLLRGSLHGHEQPTASNGSPVKSSLLIRRHLFPGGKPVGTRRLVGGPVGPRERSLRIGPFYWIDR